jgi:hypothetical protein
MKIMMRARRLSGEVRLFGIGKEAAMLQEQRGTGKIARRSGAHCQPVITALLCLGLLTTFEVAAATAPIKLAVFDFELEDFSAGAAPAGTTSTDATQLANVTAMVRQLFTQSGRYELIEVGSVDAPAVRTHTLRDCNGCDADIALKLGAQQSLVGVVSRISRTEYVVKFQVRDAQTGTVVAAGDSGLRMGADYSWSRGAARLVKDQLLERQPEQ